MPYVTTRAGTELFYKDWGSGPVVAFSHGWPLSADAWDGQMLFLLHNGFRVIAHDRRSHGRSSQHGDKNDMDTYADDLGDLLDQLDVKDAVLVGHSTGGGEVARYIGRHGTGRVAKAVLLSAVTPHMAASVPIEVFDGIRKGVADTRAEYFRTFTPAFYGYNRDGVQPLEGVLRDFWRQGMQAGIAGLYDCIKAFSETDMTDDVRRTDVPLLVAHGDDDQIVPFPVSGQRVMELAPHATLKLYPGAPHGLATTHQDAFNQDLLAFIRG